MAKSTVSKKKTPNKKRNNNKTESSSILDPYYDPELSRKVSKGDSAAFDSNYEGNKERHYFIDGRDSEEFSRA